MRPLSLVLIAACSSLAACSSSSSGGSTPVDAGPPTFTEVYTTVLATKCAPCHTTAGGQGVKFGMLDMTSQSSAYTNLVNAMAAGSQCSGKGTRVVPGMPKSSVMYLKVSLDDPSPCGEKMPLGGPSLAQSDVSLIEAWITAGAKND